MSTQTPRRFSMQQTFELLLRKPSTKQIVGYLEDLKTSGLENTVEMVYPTGGRGNVYIGGGFSHSKRATLNVTSATWNTSIMAIQNGTEIFTGKAEITETDKIEPSASGYVTKYTAKGATGSEIGYVYKLNDDGTYGSEFTQATGASASAGKFVYAPATKTISFASADLTALSGSTIVCAYTRETTDTAQRISVEADTIPATVLVTAYGLAKDICSGELYPCTIEGMAQVNGNYNFDLSSDGDCSVHSLNLEFVRGCKTKKLYDFVVYESGVIA